MGNGGKSVIKMMDFTIKTKDSTGRLSPDDVKFFYYDVCFPREDSVSKMVKWDDEIVTFVKEHSITIGSMEELPSNYDWEEDSLYLDVDKKQDDNFAQSLLRHLRNGFSHFRITVSGDVFQLEDKSKDGENKTMKTTMKGAIKKELLMALVFKFRDQIEAAKEQADNNNLKDM